jgi:asparagine synthase (glutamine-hydrolysing)
LLSSLEVRCPLLDYRLLELAASVPPAMRVSGGRGKHLLRRALRGVLPDGILDRSKMGFGVPLERWFRDDLAGFVREVLLDRRTAERDIFAPRGLETLIRGQASRAQLTPHLWAALMFELWSRTYLDAR